jgi:hypothetical protein
VGAPPSADALSAGARFSTRAQSSIEIAYPPRPDPTDPGRPAQYGQLENSVVPTGGVETALNTPSGQQSGLKMNVDLTVEADKVADFVLDFDIGAGDVAQPFVFP